MSDNPIKNHVPSHLRFLELAQKMEYSTIDPTDGAAFKDFYTAVRREAIDQMLYGIREIPKGCALALDRNPAAKPVVDLLRTLTEGLEDLAEMLKKFE